MSRHVFWLSVAIAAGTLAGCSNTTTEPNTSAGVNVAPGTVDDGGVTDDKLCGNGVVDEGEICDVAIPVPQEGCCAFPEFCVDQDPCTVDKLINDGTCLADCDFTEEVGPSGSVQDRCCPTGATSATDADCEDSCGNGVIDEGESCDPGLAESCPTECEDDGDPCTTQSLVTADPCNPECVTTDIIEQISGDGCCPDGATMAQDSDCPPDMMGPVCGDGVVDDGETCDTAITDGEGACPTLGDCDDGDACTVDVVNGAGTCTAACGTDGEPGAGAADGCCPTGADSTTDPDCEAEPMCGDGNVDPGEACDDGNNLNNDGCEGDCTLSPTLFRVSKLTLGDPNVQVNSIVDGTLADVIDGDDDGDGALDLNILLIGRPFTQDVPGNTAADIVAGDCLAGVFDPPGPPQVGLTPVSCTIQEGAQAAPITVVNQDSGDCYVTDPDVLGDAVDPELRDPAFAVSAGDAGCFPSTAASFDLVLGTLVIPLSNVTIAGQYNANPATKITGLIQGFLAADASTSQFVPDGVALFGNRPLYAIFALGPLNVDQGPGGQRGWTVTARFEADSVNALDNPILFNGGPLCGNGVVDAFETCDVAIASGPGSCVDDCDDGIVCTTDTLVNGNPCAPTCTNVYFGDDGSDDCCPQGGNFARTDPDCAEIACGDGVVGPDESCDTSAGVSCDSLAACDDGNPCTADALDPDPPGGGGGRNIVNECTVPQGTSTCSSFDILEAAECIATCGDGVVVAPEACDPASGTPCDSLAACDDGDPCTRDSLAGSLNVCGCAEGTCVCTNEAFGANPLTADFAADGCCFNDNVFTDAGDPDCSPGFCGNGVVDPGEECDDGNLIQGDGCQMRCVLTP